MNGSFDRLLYTDCRAGTGRGGGGGFQVQAQSAGVDAAQAKMAVGWLLYEAPEAWIVDRRPVEDFPLGFAHAADAGYGTAQSRYVGTEATGARQGNHLADCLLTRDADLYGPTRPAQLWRSELWRPEPWDTTECPQFKDAPPLGPLTVEAVADWVCAQPARAEVLARLVSALEDPAGPQVVIAASQPDEALRWIAAATLVLPIRAALGVSFKVFTATPQRAGHRVIGVCKELHPQTQPGRAGSALVVDAEQASSDEFPVSERAQFWVGLLATAEDPYDVVDAVELAAAIGEAERPGGPDARITAWAITAPGSPLDDSAPLVRWLRAADAKLQHEHGPAVVRRILAAGADADTWRWIDAAARAQFDTDRQAVRGALLAAEIAEIRTGGRPPGERLPGVAVADSDLRDAQSELSSAIALAPDADTQVDLLLRLAWRHGSSPQPGPLRDRLHAFAVGWVDHPKRDYSPASWALRDEIIDFAHDELQARLAAGGLPAVGDALARLWRHLADRAVDAADPLSAYLQVAAVRSAPSDRRLAELRARLDQAGRSSYPENAMGWLQRAIVDWRVLGSSEAMLVIRALPPSVPVAPEILDAATPEIQRRSGSPTSLVLDALGCLQRRGLVPAGQPYSGLLAADRDVYDFVQATKTAKFRTEAQWGQRWVAKLGQVEPSVLRVRLPQVLQACLDFPQPGLGSAVLRVLPGRLAAEFAGHWRLALEGEQQVRAAAEGFCWHADGPPREVRPTIAEAFDRLGPRLDAAGREQLYRQVLGLIGAEHEAAWRDLLGYREPKPRRTQRKDG